jgi:hypothetical protein
MPVRRMQRIGGWPSALTLIDRVLSVVPVLLARPAVLSVLIAPLWVKKKRLFVKDVATE